MKRKQLKILILVFFLLFSTFGLITPVFGSPARVTSRTYTSNNDFEEGTLVGLEHDTVSDQLQLDKESGTLPFIWVPNSNEGTVSKYDTVTGKELGRYRTGPTTLGDPSRTTVDREGSVFFGNRDTGTVVKIGLYEKGNWIDKNDDGDCDTSEDLNDDGKITGAEILPWDTDECVLFSTLLPIWNPTTCGPRGIAVDANNDLWVGTYESGWVPFNIPIFENKLFHIDGDTGSIIDIIDLPFYWRPTLPIPTLYASRSYGALIDGEGNIWSSSLDSYVLKINPNTRSITRIGLSLTSYGLGIDSLGHVFVAGWAGEIDRMARIDINLPHNVLYGAQYDTHCRGVAVTSDGDVWVANSYNGNVTRLSNDLAFKATINVGPGSWGATTTGVAVDGAGKVWACNYGDGYLHRIDPDTNTIDLSVQTPGMSGFPDLGKHYSYSDMTGIIAWSITTKTGTWTVDFDSGEPDTPWGKVSWDSSEPVGTSVTVRVRSSNNINGPWSGWVTAVNGDWFSKDPVPAVPDGRYLQIETTLQILQGDISPILYELTVNADMIEATVDFHPETLNRKSKGNWVTVYIELPEDYDVADIDISTILLNGIIPAEIHPTDIGDHDNDDFPDLMVKFNRSAVIDLLSTGDDREITITGELSDGTLFEGTDEIRVICGDG